MATQASTFAIKVRFYELNLKNYKWGVKALNQEVREKLADLIAAGNASDGTDVMISLFRAYKTATSRTRSSNIPLIFVGSEGDRSLLQLGLLTSLYPPDLVLGHPT